MGREVKRVPLDFDWDWADSRKVWDGYVMPDSLREADCPDCKNGYSPHAQRLFDQWYGNVLFDPASTGSTPLTHETPAVRAFAERNVTSAPDFYGAGERAVVREALRLADLWNGQWCHHLAQEDVDALVAGNRLWDFTRTWSREAGWQKIEPPVVPTAAQVNEWSLQGLGHDSLNAGIVIRARCEREGVDPICATCGGHGSLEAHEGQRAESEAWEPTEPPEGPGYQLWETVSEGSPITPVFATPEELARYMVSHRWGRQSNTMASSYDVALKFVQAGWAPSGVFSPEHGHEDGVEAIGRS